MTGKSPLRVYLVDDEALALKRLVRLLRQTRRVEILGSTVSPVEAVEFLSQHAVDVVFLDIQMPGMTGFELLQRLPQEPAVIFTTAFDRFALDAFEVNSIDYLVKPIELDRWKRPSQRLNDYAVRRRRSLKRTASGHCPGTHAKVPERIASRIGERVVFVEVSKVTHFYAKDKLTFAATASKDYLIDVSISDLEEKLDPALFIRIHRATLLNLSYVDEVSSWFGGGMVVRLKDGKRTELPIARDRLREVKERLDF